VNGTPYPYGLRDGIIPVPDGVIEVRGFRVVGGLEYTVCEPITLCETANSERRIRDAGDAVERKHGSEDNLLG